MKLKINNYKRKLLFTDIDRLIYEIKTKHFSKDKEMFDFSIYLAKSKYYYDSNKLVVAKMKDKTNGGAIEEFVGLKTKMYSVLADDSSVYKNSKGVNKNIAAIISYKEYKDALLNYECLRHLMNRI